MRCIGLKAAALAAGVLISGAGFVHGATEANAPARLEMTDDGMSLSTPAGMTLYVNGDREGRLSCSANVNRETRDAASGLGTYPVLGHRFARSCLDNWTPYVADANAQPVGEFSVVARPDGTKQWAYQGNALYLSVRDKRPGERNGVPGFANGAGGRPGGGGGGMRGAAFRLAGPPIELPPGFRLTRIGDEIVVATKADRAVYTPKGKRTQACAACDDLLQPIAAPAIANVSGDWSIVEVGAGTNVYAFKGKPLYAPAVTLSDAEIADAGGWEMVVYRKTTPPPADILTRFTLVGDVYTTKDGMTLYTYNNGDNDLPGSAAAFWVSLCGAADECARRWKPYLAEANAKPQGEWSVVEVAHPIFTDPAGPIYPPDAPRVKAWAYRGHVVYTYYEDKAPGDIWADRFQIALGHGFGAVRVPGKGALN